MDASKLVMMCVVLIRRKVKVYTDQTICLSAPQRVRCDLLVLPPTNKFQLDNALPFPGRHCVRLFVAKLAVHSTATYFYTASGPKGKQGGKKEEFATKFLSQNNL